MISDAEAAEVLLERRQARTSLAAFSAFMNPAQPPALHHRLLCDALDQIVEGTLTRLMVFMPPGSAKSTYTSVNFPSYYLGRFPDKNIISSSSGKDLATSFGRKVRNIVDSKEYGTLFETRLAEDLKSKGEWATQNEGSYFACGVGSNVVGRRGDLGLIDDPVSSREDADSENSRNRTWEWYLADFYPRLKPEASQAIIQTRWHEDDLSGRILPADWNGESGDFKGFDGQIWKVICIPAQARENDALGRKSGDWLWTEWFKDDFWEITKAVQTSKDVRNWNALYQQIPQPESGEFFQREWFKRFNIGEQPKLSIYAASDYAVTDGGGDFTEHGVGGFDSSENLYFIDWWSGQTSPDVWIQTQFKLANIHHPLLWVAEGGVIRRAVEPFLTKAKRDQKTYFTSEWITSGADKAANARSFQALASMGKVYIPSTEWGDELINQLVKFIPNTNFKDDKVDVCGLFGRILGRTYGSRPTQAPSPKIVDLWGRPVKDNENWKIA